MVGKGKLMAGIPSRNTEHESDEGRVYSKDPECRCRVSEGEFGENETELMRTGKRSRKRRWPCSRMRRGGLIRGLFRGSRVICGEQSSGGLLVVDDGWFIRDGCDYDTTSATWIKPEFLCKNASVQRRAFD